MLACKPTVQLLLRHRRRSPTLIISESRETGLSMHVPGQCPLSETAAVFKDAIDPGQVPPSSPRLLAAGISKTYGSHRALTDATLRVAVGQVHAVVGQNGSGKPTLIRLATHSHKAAEHP